MLQDYLRELLLIHIPEALVLSFVIAYFLRVRLEYLKIMMIVVIAALTAPHSNSIGYSWLGRSYEFIGMQNNIKRLLFIY